MESKNAMKGVVIQHLPFEDTGVFGDVLADANIHCERVDAPRDDLAPARDADLTVILGGPISANDVRRFPFLKTELDLIEHRLAQAKPTLGVCLGAQLIAKALGAAIRPLAQKEIGWSALEPTAAGTGSPLACLTTPVLHWHGETFDLPDGTENLARTDLCPNQAFAVGGHTLALQFHAEVREESLAQWLVGHIVELDRANISLEALRRDAGRWGSQNEASGKRMLRQWLRQWQPSAPGRA